MKAVNSLLFMAAFAILSHNAIADVPSWDRLAPAHQEVLSDFQSSWESLPDERREQLLRRAENWQKLSPDCREALQSRWQELKELPPEVRSSLRERWQSMSPEQRREAMQNRPHKARCQQPHSR